jgi:glycine hydroxymethyltransferase
MAGDVSAFVSHAWSRPVQRHNLAMSVDSGLVESVRTAPWASDRALDRLADVEATLPDDTAAALALATDAVFAHERRIEQDALLLYAGGNVPTALGVATHHPLLSNQPSMGYAGDKFQAGLEALDVLEVAVSRLVADVMGAEFAEVRPTSATLANLAVYTAVAQPGDTIAVLPGWAGGHLSHHEIGAPGIRGLRVVELPYDLRLLDVDLDRVGELLAAEQPKLVVVGASLMLHSHRLAPLVDLVHDAGARLLYDASHVAGLLAEGRFQTPLVDGVDVVTFSTYKSFGGPAGGAIVSNDPTLMERITAAVYPGLTANYDIARLLPLGAAALEHRQSAGAYADACIAVASALADALAAEGLDVVTCERGPTSSHHIAVDVRAFGGGREAARTLAGVNVLLSEIGLPGPDRDPQGAIRIGTQTVVRQGLGPGDMGAVAAVLAGALRGERPADALRAEVAEIRRVQPGTVTA